MQKEPELTKGGFNKIRTSNFETIERICTDAQKKHKLTAIIGYTGAGKTTALKSYCTATKNTYYVECKNSMNRKQFLQAVLIQLGVNYYGTVYDMVETIVREINTKQNPLLVIDEAGKLNMNLILDLHDLRNATIDKAGMVLAGCEYFQNNIEKKANDQKQGYPEFHSRVINWNVLAKPTKTEIKAIAESNGITNLETIKEFYKHSNYRLLYNAITNERD